jgi:carboxylesterase
LIGDSMVAAAALAGAGVSAAAAVLRQRRIERVERESAARLPVGSDGIVPGAHSISHSRSRTHAALLVHGFGDTPQTLAGLAQHLADEHHWSVLAPLLPGHGRTLRNFRASRRDDWILAVRESYETLRAEHDTVVLVGLSFGCSLTVLEAARRTDLPAMALIAPYLTPTAGAERMAPVAPFAEMLWPYLLSSNPELAIHNPAARVKSLGYGAVTPRLVRELVLTSHAATECAARVTSPVLLVHSTNDYRVPLPLADRHAALFESAVSVRVERFSNSGHVLTVDNDAPAVWALTAGWLAAQAGAPTR